MADHGKSEGELRQWLHRIEEACARRGATTLERVIRAAAMAALRGDPAPVDPGMLLRTGEKR